MDAKDPGLWGAILEWLGQPSPTVQGFLMAMVIAGLRVMYDRKEKAWQRILLEALLCGLLTVAGTSLAALAIGFWWPQFQAPLASIAVGLGGAIGFFGVEAVRRLAIKLLRIRLTDMDNGG
ncbi:phage holin, lambda family [Aquipseudomonas alcaligenes]|uniref:Phage holin, lambda family n=1 Tax=Aquipseudomonas alcaligenes TaxID=43263 RepID=A0A1N6S8C3_AQUAC|nr:phage holin, lambda family [Pseudomonas alcaligenes]SIQ37345.1 phage holin, lambda family [Pseudomonas alcaligenes]